MNLVLRAYLPTYLPTYPPTHLGHLFLHFVFFPSFNSFPTYWPVCCFLNKERCSRLRVFLPSECSCPRYRSYFLTSFTSVIKYHLCRRIFSDYLLSNCTCSPPAILYHLTWLYFASSHLSLSDNVTYMCLFVNYLSPAVVYESYEGKRCVFCSLQLPPGLEQCLAHSRPSRNIY